MKLRNLNSTWLMSLYAVEQEKTDLDFDGLIFDLKFVATIINVAHQITHILAVKRGHTDQHLEKDHTQGPRVHCVIVTLALQNLR